MITYFLLSNQLTTIVKPLTNIYIFSMRQPTPQAGAWLIRESNHIRTNFTWGYRTCTMFARWGIDTDDGGGGNILWSLIHGECWSPDNKNSVFVFADVVNGMIYYCYHDICADTTCYLYYCVLIFNLEACRYASWSIKEN